MKIDFHEQEIDILIQYIDFMIEKFDDDPDFREHAITARKKLTEAKEEVIT